MTDDLQSWSEVPRIAHFCSLFRKAFDLLEFDIQDLEEGLLLLEDEERLVPQLLVKLLKGCSRTFTKVVNEDNYNKYLRRLFISKAEEAEEDEIDYDFECEEFIERSVNFEDCSLRNRVRILHQLCEFRLDGEDVSDKVKNLEASSLRVEPLGKDSEGFTYWYFYGTRLYKEAAASSSSLSLRSPSSSEDKKRRKEKDKKKRKKKEKKKKKKKNSHSSSDDDNYADSTPTPTWSVACLTLQDWIDLTDKMRHSKKKHDKDLYLTLSDNFLPEIIKMFADKEREERRRLRLLAPKRTSSRIERKRAEQEEKDRVLAEKLEEDRQPDEDDDGRFLGDGGKRRSRRRNEESVVERNRSERMRQREQMKELREKKIAEKEVAKAFPSEVETQKKNLETKKEPSSPQIEGEDDLSDVSLSPNVKKTRKTSSKRNTSDDIAINKKKEEEEEEQEEVVFENEDKLSAKNSKDSKKLSSKSSSVKRESLKRKKRRPKSSVRSSKRRKWKSDSSSNEDNDDEDDDDYKEDEELEDDMFSASSEEHHQSESSAGEEQIKDLIKREEENEAEDDDEDETYESPKVSKTSSFANALLKVGTKSTRDSNLDKTIRKSPGRLLQTAGLQKSGTISSSSSKMLNGDRVNGGSVNTEKNNDNNVEEDQDEDEEPKISFSLYGGHLPVDIGGFSKSPSGESSPAENRLSGLSSSSSGVSIKKKEEPESPVRKVFSNWGGEFFKKNLDYRANTNKILEKMNLTTTTTTTTTTGSGSGGGVSLGSGGSSINSSNPPRKDFLSPFKKTMNNQTSNNIPSPSEEKKPSIKPFLGFS